VDKVQGVLDTIVNRFISGDIPQAVAYAMFPIPNIPSQKWSMLNQIVQYFSGTQDGRGYRQWLEAKRYVKKGATAFYILCPRIKTENKGTPQEKKTLIGFLASPVFRVEDTDGEPLDYMKLKLPELPLIERAIEWGIKTIPVMGNTEYFGYYSPDKKVIALATPEEKTFFHELAHVAHEQLLGELKNGQDPIQEIVAELSALTLCQLIGKTGDKYFGNSDRYIEGYAKDMKVSASHAVIQVLTDVKNVLSLIIGSNQFYSESLTVKCNSCNSEISVDTPCKQAYCEQCESVVFVSHL